MMAFLTAGRPQADLCAGVAAGLAGGAYLIAAPLLGTPVGMPGEAVRYLLLTGMLLAAAVGAVLQRRDRVRPRGPRAPALWGMGACVLAGAAPLTASPLVFAVLLLVAAGLGGGALGLYRPEHAWHAACLAGAGVAGTATALFARHPQGTCAPLCALAALLLLPLCLRGAPQAAGLASSPPFTAGAVGAAVFGALFAAQELLVFRWELLAGAGARPYAYAALLSAAVTSGLAVADRFRPHTSTSTAAGAGTTVLFAAGLTAAVVACAGAARPWQFILALATALTCGAAATARTESSRPQDRASTTAAGHAVAALCGGAAAVTVIALSGRQVGGPDTLTAVGLAPVVVATAPWVSPGLRHLRTAFSLRNGRDGREDLNA
ncbi:hypothetical protein [Streptomyces sp. NPDC002990]